MKNRYIFYLLFIIGIVLGFSGLFWGLGDLGLPIPGISILKAKSFSPDEGFSLAGGILFHKGTPFKEYFIWGGTAQHFISMLIVKTFLFFGVSLRELTSTKAFYVIIFGRFISLLSSILVGFFLYLTGKNIKNKTFGILAALFWIAFPIQIEQSNYFRPDFFAILAISIACWVISKYINNNNHINIYLSILFIGVATSFRITNIIFLLCYVPYVFKFPNNKKIIFFIKAFILFSLGFFLLSYMNLLYLEYFLTFYKSWSLNSYNQPETFNRVFYILYYLYINITHSLGIYFCIIIIFGFIIFCIKRPNFFYFYFIGIVLSLIFSGFQYKYIASRYLLPFYFFSIIPCLWGYLTFLDYLCEYFKKKLLPTKINFYIILIIKNLLIYSILIITIIQGLNRFYLKNQIDTRIKARNWIEKNIPLGTPIAMVGFTSAFNCHPWTHHVPTYFFGNNYKELTGNKSLYNFNFNYIIVNQYDLDQFKRLKKDHPFSSESIYLNQVRKGMTIIDNKKWIEIKKFKASYPFISLLNNRYEEPDDFRYSSPTILIYKKR